MRLADNHAGWEVQAYDNLGWFRVFGPLPTKAAAVEAMKSLPIDHEYRVVESLCHTK